MLRFLLIFILVLIVLNLVGRVTFQWFLKRMIKKHQERANGFNTSQQGDIYVNVNRKEKKNIPENIGEYVEFEELK